MLERQNSSSPRPPEEPGATSASGSEPYIPPNDAPEPLTGHTALPQVKRFNRKMVVGLGFCVAVVVVAAFGVALTRGPPAQKFADPSAQAAAAAPTASDAINSLPGDYAEARKNVSAAGPSGIPTLGPPLPGDIGAVALRDGVRTGQPAANRLSPYEQALEQQRIDELKRAQKARETGFGFTGGSSNVSSGAAGTYQMTADRESPAAAVGAALAGLAKPATDRDADNRQDDKTAFLDKERQNRWALERSVQWPTSPYTMLAGTILPGVLITGINSDLPGQIKGQISQNVYDTVTGHHLLLPQGTEVLGEYDSRITYGQSRVLVVWTRLIRPDGSNIDLENMPGVDLSGYAGLTGKVDRHLGRLITAVVLGSLIEAGAQSGTNYTVPTFTDRARQGAGQGVNEATQQIVRKELSVQPTIRVAPGARFNVFATKDIVLPPYKG